MKLATLKNGTRDGKLVVVSRDLTRACAVDGIAATLQGALDDWSRTQPLLDQLSEQLNALRQRGDFIIDPRQAMAPLPRAYQWMDGSVYVNHIRLMQKAFAGDSKIVFNSQEPLVYQGGSDVMLGPTEDIEAVDEDAGIDFEGEVAVITDDVRMGTDATEAANKIRLVMLVNDVSLRNLILHELGKGFGFYQAKPATAFAPVAVTPDELGSDWRDGLLHLPLVLHWNDQLFGQPNAGDGAGFNFADLIAHAAKTRHLCAGSIIGLGTVSSAAPGAGSACIAEHRAMQRLAGQENLTPYMRFGDRIRMDMTDRHGRSVFGAIDQRVRQLRPNHAGQRP